MAANRAFAQLYVRPTDSLAGHSPRLLTPGDFDEDFLKKLDKTTMAGGWSGRLPNCDARGRRFEVALRTLPVTQPEGRYFLGLACRPGDEEGTEPRPTGFAVADNFRFAIDQRRWIYRRLKST
ncbi:MAG: hypothetical protein WDM96_01290 [Lacunisphaera sp.]